MINLIIAIVAGLVTTIGSAFLLGGGDFRPLYGILPGLIVFGGSYFYLARKAMKELETYFLKAQEELKGQHIDRAVEILKEAYPLGKKQFLVGPQIDGQIGTVLYMSRRFDESEPYLKRSFNRNWVPRAMLGALYYKRKKTAEMRTVFEEAVKHSKKQALLWNLYAYCLWKSNDREGAIAVLNRAVTEMPEDQKTQSNLKALQNDKKMKMRGWSLLWYQFHLEKPPAQQSQFPARRR